MEFQVAQEAVAAVVQRVKDLVVLIAVGGRYREVLVVGIPPLDMVGEGSLMRIPTEGMIA